jgi:hypothetical protein
LAELDSDATDPEASHLDDEAGGLVVVDVAGAKSILERLPGAWAADF